MDEEAKDLPESNDTEINEETAKSAISSDLIRGHINTIILRALYERDKYGYEIIEEIERKSHGQYVLKQPTLYSALKRLEAQGYINAYWKTDEISLGGRRKYYALTESGREVTEKNQAEWEYSRTVIDNLISDRSFDFSQPAPSSLDFKILKQSTSRVPLVKTESDDTSDDTRKDKENIEDDSLDKETEEIKTETENGFEENRTDNQKNEGSEENNAAASIQSAQQPEINPDSTSSSSSQSTMTEEQRRIVHENYLRLISEPVRSTPENVVPVAENIDTNKLIYNNKPETERDYRNLINNLFVKTITRNPRQSEQNGRQSDAYLEPNTEAIRLDDVNMKADSDGLKVNTAEYIIGSRRKSYNRGGALFKSSAIITVFLLLEFVFSLLFKSELDVGIAYPFVILAVATAQLLIFGVLYFTDFGRISRKPVSNTYISASIVVTIIFILIIFIVSILLNINFGSVGDIMAKLIIPCLVVLNIPAFSICFYLFSK